MFHCLVMEAAENGSFPEVASIHSVVISNSMDCTVRVDDEAGELCD